eukprot:3133192-Rhodomonas_salina.3
MCGTVVRYGATRVYTSWHAMCGTVIAQAGTDLRYGATRVSACTTCPPGELVACYAAPTRCPVLT